MIFWHILSLSILMVYELLCHPDKTANDCNLTMDQFQLNINIHQFNKVTLLYQLKECKKCALSVFKTFESNQNNIILDSNYNYRFKAVDSNNQTICAEFEFDDTYGECGEYELNVIQEKCSIKMVKQPNNIYSPLYMAARVLIIFVLLTNLAQKFGVISPAIQLRSKDRLLSLDTFRGISLFVMIFVNYGSGGYHALKHADWHGITIADFVFPWFLFIMGFSIPLATHSSLRKSRKYADLFFRILARSLKMFAIGLMLNSRYGVELSSLRIMGVLQRISICYFVVSSLELCFFKRIHRTYFSAADFFVLSLVGVWTWIVFFLSIQGCPKGYFGPGGLESNSLYHNCTGGATGYIDQLILGSKLMYSRPTCSKIYKTTQSFDPEGILGSLNSILLTYLGCRAGRLLTIDCKNKVIYAMKWLIYSFLCLFAFYLVTNFDLKNGLIPVNKNIWTLSYTLITASSSFLLQAMLYYIIDVKQLWTGNPFCYLGSNSILIYICHCLFNKTLPSQWLVSHTHFAQVLMHLWGAIFWTLISIYLHSKNFFFNL